MVVTTQKLVAAVLVSHQTVSARLRFLSSPKLSGKYNEMDHILIGIAVSEYIISEMIKSAVPLVKVLWRMIIFSMFMITWLKKLMLLLSNSENQGENKISASIHADV